jgi:hypothetical protein
MRCSSAGTMSTSAVTKTPSLNSPGKLELPAMARRSRTSRRTPRALQNLGAGVGGPYRAARTLDQRGAELLLERVQPRGHGVRSNRRAASAKVPHSTTVTKL